MSAGFSQIFTYFWGSDGGQFCPLLMNVALISSPREIDASEYLLV